MIANYHTHTTRCHHALGTEREYIEAAIAGGLKILGFSDHTPQLYDGGYENPWKMSPADLEGYCHTVLSLKKEYQDDIEIHLGLEVEYLPAFFPKLLSFVSQYPIEYFLLGQHYLGNETGDAASGTPTSDPKTLDRYISQVEEALRTGRFTYLAHPDIMPFTGNPAVYREKMRGLCLFARMRDIPLEINLLGIEYHKCYPNPVFWEIAGDVGCRAVLGSDAHLPGNVVNQKAIQKAMALAAGCHLTLDDTVPFQDPFPDLHENV